MKNKIALVAATIAFTTACIADYGPAETAEETEAATKASTPVADPGTVLVASGSFSMGCNSKVDSCRSDELPYHSISLNTFEIDVTEVTQAAYQSCIASGVCTLPQAWFDPVNSPNQPVRDVSWQQASQYCGWVGKRLPTEAEWEKAARGTQGSVYPWGNATPGCSQANIQNCVNGPENVGLTTGLSPYGAHDMAGNVWEWVSDWYNSSYYSSSPKTNPTGPATGSMKVARGGSFNFGASGARTAIRIEADPTLAYDDIGFRCAKSR